MTDTANNAPNPNKARDRVADRERAARALDLRRDGHTWRAIADKVGYHDAGTAYTAVSRLLARVESSAAGEYREIASQRYEQLWRDVVDALDNLEPGREVAAAQLITTGRGILDAMCRLHGLNSEVATTPVVKVRDDVADELSRLTAAMQAAGWVAEDGRADRLHRMKERSPQRRDRHNRAAPHVAANYASHREPAG